jgi:hypothetical protein
VLLLLLLLVLLLLVWVLGALGGGEASNLAKYCSAYQQTW